MTQIGLNGFVGYLFMKMLAVRFGTSGEKDVFDIAYSIPFIIMNIGGLAFAHAIVAAQFAKFQETNPEKAQPLFATIATCALLGSALLTGLCAVFPEQICAAIAGGLSIELLDKLQHLTLLLLPMVCTLSMCTLLSAVSTGYGLPLSTELGPLVARSLVFAGLAAGFIGGSLTSVCIALSICSFAGLAMVWIWQYRATGLRIRPSFDFLDPDFTQIIRQAGAFCVAACVTQASMAYMRRLATFDGVGTNASLTYAISLLSPLGLLFGKPLSLVTGPSFARAFAAGDLRHARAIVDRAVLSCLILGVAVAAATSILAVPLIRLLYGGGRFDESAVEMTAGILRCMAWCLPGSTVLWAVMMPLIAVSRSQRAALIYIGGHGLHFVFMMVFFPMWGSYALAWGFAVPTAFQAIAGLFVVYRALDTRVLESTTAVGYPSIAADQNAAETVTIP